MKRILLLAAFSLTAVASTVSANTYELPDEKPVASVTIPSTWKQDKYEDGVECVSPKNEVYLAIEGIESDSIEESVKDAIKFLKKKGVSIKKDTEKQQHLKINDMEGDEVVWEGKDEDGDCVVSLAFLQVTKKRGLMVVYWSSTDVAKKNDAALATIIRSIKPIEK